MHIPSIRTAGRSIIPLLLLRQIQSQCLSSCLLAVPNKKFTKLGLCVLYIVHELEPEESCLVTTSSFAVLRLQAFQFCILQKGNTKVYRKAVQENLLIFSTFKAGLTTPTTSVRPICISDLVQAAHTVLFKELEQKHENNSSLTSSWMDAILSAARKTPAFNRHISQIQISDSFLRRKE